MAAASVWFLSQDYAHTMESETGNLKKLSLSVVNQIDDFLGEIELACRTFDTWLTANPGADPRFDAQFLSMVETFRHQTKNMIDIRLVDESGGLYYLPPSSAMPLANASDREYFLAQRNPALRGFYLSSPVQSRVTQTWLIPISFPIANPRQGIWLMYAILDFQVMERMFQEILPSPNGTITLIRSDGMVLFSLPINMDFIGKPLTNISDFQRLRDGDRVFELVQSEDTNRILALITWSNSNRLPFSAIASVNYTDFIMPWVWGTCAKSSILLVASALILFLTFRMLALLRSLEESRIKLEVASRHDSLTGLYNRGYFWLRALEEIARADRYKGNLALILCDLDDFKRVNDSFGHPEGDRVLVATAEAIRSSIRKTDFAGRMGGEEFAVLLSEDQEHGGVLVVAERIRQAAWTIAIPNGNMSISLGVAFWDGAGETLDQLYKRADSALYFAKQAGKNRVIEWQDNADAPGG
jgi:diguanylate cyclase (GGDEF)-like protein